MTLIRCLLLLAAFAVLLPGCVAQTAVESRQITAPTGAPTDARRRAEAHTALAAEYYQRGAFTVAIAEARAAINDDPTYAPAHNMQALVYMQLREDAEANAAFERALKLDPNNPELLNNFGWFLCLRNDTSRGLEMMRRAASDTLYPTPEKAWYSIGLCHRRSGNVAEAEEALRRAVLIRPDMIGALFNLAQVSYERGNTKDAENYLGRYTRMATPSMEALVLGVKIARANNDRSSEDSFMQQLRRRYPDAPELRDLETRK